MKLRPSGIHRAIGTHFVVTNFALPVYSPEFKTARHFHECACYAVLQAAATESFGSISIESNHTAGPFSDRVGKTLK